MMKKILHLCADIGSDSQPYADNGYEVIRIGQDIGVENYHPPQDVYGIIANPPCTEFSFAKTNSKNPRDLEKGMVLVKHCLRIIWECQYSLPYPTAKKTNLQFWMLENPFGFLRRFLGNPTLIYQPYEFGDNYKKKTCVWGFFNMPKKNPIECTMPKFDQLKTKDIHYEGYEHLTRTERRSISSPGFVKAFYEANR
tara:strand:- start:721 stop:1308 length:588 start_codon:yes stop_codon:yes gene_type:complete